ncbi:MAG: hypothetical protein LBG44_04745 [Gemmatimonadota bacterium]|nr:hypothetical protein [Gemmatimonadota bacterium]
MRVKPGDLSSRWNRRADVSAVHRIVLSGVAVLFATGILITAAEFEEFVETPVFWIKLALVGLLVVNGALLTRKEEILPERTEAPLKNNGEWARVRRHALFSVTLWIATAAAGIVLSYLA